MLIRPSPRFLRDLRLRNKFMFFFLFIISFSFLMFTAGNIYFISMLSKEKTLFILRQYLDNTVSSLDFRINLVRNTLNYLSSNETIQTLSTKSESAYTDNLGEWIVDYNRLKSEIDLSNINEYVGNIHIFMRSGISKVFDTEEIHDMVTVQNTFWFEDISSSRESMKWYFIKTTNGEDAGQDLFAVKKIPGRDNIFNFCGLVLVYFPVSEITSLFMIPSATGKPSIILSNSSYDIIAQNDSGLFTTSKYPAVIREMETGVAASINSWRSLRIGRNRFFVFQRSIEKTDWVLSLFVPYSGILSLGLDTSSKLIVIFILIIPLILPISLLVSSSITRRIQNLIRQTQKVQEGVLALDIEYRDHGDEIDDLARNFHFMMERIAALLNEKYIMGKELKDKEFRALQAQINPHFLYNTLDMISWMAFKYNAQDIRELVHNLGRFYKLCLSKGNDIIPLRDELEHLRLFVRIQNMRFDNKIDLKIDIPDDLLDCEMLKLLLQPIVENSILHGILEKEEESGTIEVKIIGDGESLLISIQDDGIGMSDQKIEELFSARSDNASHGYGLKNINERIKNRFGTGYGLQCVSSPGKGTSVVMKIPFHRISRREIDSPLTVGMEKSDWSGEPG